MTGLRWVATAPDKACIHSRLQSHFAVVTCTSPVEDANLLEQSLFSLISPSFRRQLLAATSGGGLDMRAVVESSRTQAAHIDIDDVTLSLVRASAKDSCQRVLRATLALHQRVRQDFGDGPASGDLDALPARHWTVRHVLTLLQGIVAHLSQDVVRDPFRTAQLWRHQARDVYGSALTTAKAVSELKTAIDDVTVRVLAIGAGMDAAGGDASPSPIARTPQASSEAFSGSAQASQTCEVAGWDEVSVTKLLEMPPTLWWPPRTASLGVLGPSPNARDAAESHPRLRLSVPSGCEHGGLDAMRSVLGSMMHIASGEGEMQSLVRCVGGGCLGRTRSDSCG